MQNEQITNAAQIVDAVRQFEGSLVLTPTAGSDSPELAWGDSFFYYAPDGSVPQNEQPYATIITKDYPDDTLSRLDPPERWRVNIHVDQQTFLAIAGEDPRQLSLARDFSVTDQMMPHPVYGSQGWVCVVCPGEQTSAQVLDLLRAAHRSARARAERRAGSR